MPVNVGQIVVSLVGNTATFSMQMTEAERKAAAAGAGIQGSLAKLTGSAAGFSSAGAAVTKFSANVRESNGSLALMSEELGVHIPRHLRGFVSSLPGVGTALAGAFTGLAVVGIVEIIGSAIKKVGEFRDELKKLEDSPGRIHDAFRGVALSTETSNDELRVTNDQLEKTIAKLQGKPSNGLMLALHEAWVEADKLAAALGKDLEQAQKALEQQSVGFWGHMWGYQPTDELSKQAEKFRRDINKSADDANQKIHALKPGSKEAESLATERDTKLAAAYAAELARVNEQLTTAERLQANRPMIAPYSGAPQSMYVAAGLDQSAMIAALTEYRHIVQMSADTGGLMTANARDKGILAGAPAASLTKPFEDRINELGAKLQAAIAKAGAAGGTELEKALAEAAGKADEVIAQLGKDRKAPLTEGQKEQIETKETEIALVDLEAKYRDALAATSRAIEQKTAVQLMMNAAIGQGAAAQRQAFVESQVAEHFGERYKTDWGTAAANQLRQQYGAEYDAKRAGTSAENVLRLNQETAATQRLTAAEREGAEAMHQVALANKLAEMVGAGASPAVMFATMAQMQAQWNQQQVQSVTQIERQTEATRNLTAAQWGGVDAIRAAEEENIRNSGVSKEVADAKIAELRAQHDLQDVEAVTKATHDQELENLQHRLALLMQMREANGQNLEIDKAIKDTQDQISKITDKQRLATGSALDGVKAFFDEMRRNTHSAAQDVHDILQKSFEDLNDAMSKLLTGQKVNWSSFFTGIGQQLVKSSLQRGEGMLTKLLGLGGAGAHDGSSPSSPLYVSVVDSGSGGGEGGQGGILSQFLHMGGETGGDEEAMSSFDLSDLSDMGMAAPAMAAGGDVAPGSAYLVGESGPEIFKPSGGGTIIPHNAIGGTTINVDARWSGDPNMTTSRVRQAIIAAHNSAVGTSLQAGGEQAKRMPQRSS